MNAKICAIVSVPTEQRETGYTAAILAGSIAPGTAISAELFLDSNAEDSWPRLMKELQDLSGHTIEIQRTRICQICESTLRSQILQSQSDTVIVIVQADSFSRLKGTFLREGADCPDENILIVRFNGSP